MNPPKASALIVRKHKGSLETAIEKAIIENPDLLGFSGANAIRNFRLAHDSGAVDVVLLPKGGSIRLVLIEAKVANAADANSKVIGKGIRKTLHKSKCDGQTQRGYSFNSERNSFVHSSRR